MGPNAVIASLLIKLGLDSSGVAQGAGQAQKAMGGFMNAANLGTAAVGAGIGSMVMSAGQQFVKFDDQMRQVFSIMPDASQAAMDKMKEDVRSLAKEYGMTTEQVIPGMYDALSSGVQQADIMPFMETAQKMAVAGVATTQESVGALAQIMNAYRLEGSEMAGVSDQMFNAVNKGVTTIPELASSMSAVTPIAASMGIGINEVLGAVTAMTLQGSSTSEAVTMMRSSLVALLKPLPPLKKGLEEAGYASGQAAIDALGYQGAMELIRKISDETGQTLPKLTGRIEGTSAVLQLTGENAEAANQALEDVTDTVGSTTKAFEIMEGGVGGMARRLQAQISDLTLSLGEAIAPIAPLMMAFGPQIGRVLAAGIGSGLALGMKGISGIMKRALPGMMAGMESAAAEYGGSFAKALGGSIATHIKSAGFKKLAFGGLALGAGAAMSSGAFGEFGGMEKIAGSLSMVAGAFMMGGPVAAGIAALVLALNQVGDFLGTVEKAQSDLNEKVANISNLSGQEALSALEGTVHMMQEAQGLTRIIGDTWGGAQMATALTEQVNAIINAEKLTLTEMERGIHFAEAAAVEAASRGNQAVADEIRLGIKTLEQMHATAADSAEGVYVAVAEGFAEGTWGAALTKQGQDIASGAGKVATAVKQGAAVVDEALDTWKERVVAGAAVISSAWDTLSASINEGPKIKTMEQRLKTAGKTLRHNTQMLRRAVRAGDVVGAAYYTDAVIAGRQATRDLKGNAETTIANARTILGRGRKESGRQHKGMATDAKRESGRGARAVEGNAKKAGKALPDELNKNKPKAKTAATGLADATKAPLESAATNATTWGGHLGTNYAAGITSKIDVVASAAAALAAAAAAPIEFSDPPPGPLHGIRSWGPHMVDEWTKPIVRDLGRVGKVGDALGRAVSPRWDGSGSGGRSGRGRLSAAGVGAVGADARGRREVHFHIGTLVADERGLDELERRMTRRQRTRRRGHRRYNDTAG